MVIRTAHSILDTVQSIVETFDYCDSEMHLAVMLGERRSPPRLLV